VSHEPSGVGDSGVGGSGVGGSGVGGSGVGGRAPISPPVDRQDPASREDRERGEGRERAGRVPVKLESARVSRGKQEAEEERGRGGGVGEGAAPPSASRASPSSFKAFHWPLSGPFNAASSASAEASPSDSAFSRGGSSYGVSRVSSRSYKMGSSSSKAAKTKVRWCFVLNPCRRSPYSKLLFCIT